jgi:glutamate formiminotransferase
MSLIECVPNVSEGRRAQVLETLAAAVRAVPGARLLDRSADPSHNRSVFTLAGSRQEVRDAVLALAWAAVQTIDLRRHEGVHPRIGAIDVVPFVPIADVTMETCVALAHETGRARAERLRLPVFLYGDAALRPERRRLEHIRRGQFEGLAARMADPAWAPDFGPAVPHPSAGAVAVGARPILIAFNVNLDTDRVDVAQRIAAAVRESSGGLPHVKALGLPLSHRGLVQVSMNLTDYTRTPIEVAFDRVAEEAERAGVGVRDSEIVGLVPQAALAHTTPARLRLAGFSGEKVLENRLNDTL